MNSYLGKGKNKGMDVTIQQEFILIKPAIH